MTEIVLLNEEDQALSSWTLYGKTGMVIGRDSGDDRQNGVQNRHNRQSDDRGNGQ